MQGLNNNDNSNNDISKKLNNFFTIFFTMKAFPLRSATICEAAISAYPSNIVIVFFSCLFNN